MQITKPQLGRLQTLYSQLAAHEIGVGTSRDARMQWATERLRKPVSSFSNLTSDDAGFLIDSIQKQLNVKAPLKRRLNRAQARRAGLDGRHDGKEYEKDKQLVSAVDLRTIVDYYTRLGWDRAGFDRFLGSSVSPLKHKSAPAIVTLNDANKVRWALKGMLIRAGKWEDRKK